MTSTFSYRPGSRVSGVVAAVAHEELERIRTSHGRLTPQAIVEEARPEEAPLHPAFEWDDSAAGEKYRLYQARVLVRSVVVAVEEAAPRAVYVHVVSGPNVGYQPMDVVVRHPDLYTAAISELRGRLAASAAAISELQSLAVATGNEQKATRPLARAERHIRQADAAVAVLA